MSLDFFLQTNVYVMPWKNSAKNSRKNIFWKKGWRHFGEA
jgi:hypothetical protein